MWWNEEIKAAVKRKKVLGARYVFSKERCMEVYKKEKRKVKRCIYQSKKEVNEQLGSKMNQDLNGNRKLFWEEVSKMNGGMVNSCRRIKGWEWEVGIGRG